MAYNLTVIASDPVTESRWARALGSALSGLADVAITPGNGGVAAPGQLVFIDGAFRGLAELLATLDRRQRAIFLLVPEGSPVPPELTGGKVDDVLVYPFRPLEALSKVRQFQQVLMWDEVMKLNSSFTEVIARLKEDLKLAERLQRSKVPSRFPEVRGFKIGSRYLAGMRSGGDHFDLAESRDGQQLSMVLSDSSSYGLSSAVLSVLMKVAMKLSVEEVRSARETVRKIQEELALTLGEKDRLSLFYGIVSRRDYKLRYLNLGSSCALLAPPKEDFIEISSQGPAITQKGGMPDGSENEVTLLPESRLALVSDGFVECVGGMPAVLEILNRHRAGDAVDCINELVYKVKEKFTEPDDLPAQDCTAVLFDVDARVMRVV
ncbi:MAG: SpoIIE family protein phosphatase [Oligoflexia bacterium]|nr:SpoIIE family protein phosphatase [Oligoflexia bacterium]